MVVPRVLTATALIPNSANSHGTTSVLEHSALSTGEWRENTTDPSLDDCAQETAGGRPPALGANVDGAPKLTKGGKRMKAHLNIASLNLNGRESNGETVWQKWNNLHFLVKDSRIGILAVQETHLSNDLAASLDRMYGKRLKIVHALSKPPHNKAGVAIIVNKDIVNIKGMIQTELIAERAIAITIHWQEDEPLTIVNIYAPNAQRPNEMFWKTLKTECDNAGIKPDVLLGDFNMVLQPGDRLPPHLDSAGQTTALQNLLASWNVIDGWRERFPDLHNYSYPVRIAAKAKSRIDRIYVRDNLLEQSEGWEVSHTAIATDHKMVQVQLSKATAPVLGRGRWTLNLAVMKNKRVVQDVLAVGAKLSKDLDDLNRFGGRTDEYNPQTIYNSFKQNVTTILRTASKKILPGISAQIQNLQTQLDLLLNDERIQSNLDLQMEATIIQDRLLKLQVDRKTNLQMATAAHVSLKNETVSKFWVNLNRAKKPRDIVFALEKTVTSPEGDRYERRSDKMAELARDYHNNLQTQHENHPVFQDAAIEEVFEHVTAKLNKRERSGLKKEFSPLDVREALYSAAAGRASGLDGIPYEFWKFLVIARENRTYKQGDTFDIMHCLSEVFNDIHEYGLYPGSNFAEGWMCPIYKNKGDRRKISNHRPITLLNTDYKILTKIVAKRLANTAPKLIHPNQAGFIPGRSIHDQIRLTELMTKYAEATEENGVIVALDQEKAYDKIDHAYLWKTLKKFQIPAKTIDLIRTLYSQAFTKVAINGELSSPFRVTRGVRQGDPMSCLLFDLAIEPLAVTLRHSNLSGFNLPGAKEKLVTTLFADDTTVYLSEEDNYDDLLKILNLWCAASKAKFNVHKTKIIPIGTPDFRSSTIANTRWNERMTPLSATAEAPELIPDGVPVRILGAQLGNNILELDIWKNALSKTDAALKLWAKGHPSLQGKKLVVQMFVGGITQFLTTAHGMPDDTRKTIEHMISAFLWEGKKAKIASSVLEQPINAGGIGLLNLKARNEAIDVMWLKSYLTFSDTRPLWALLADSLLLAAAVKNSGKVDTMAGKNPFLQSWKVAARSTAVPESLKRMLRAANRYKLCLAPLKITRKLRRRMPAWFHCGSTPESKRIQNTPAAKCLRSKHLVATVADLLKVSKRTRKQDGHSPHYQYTCCECLGCRYDKDVLGCKHPISCQRTAVQLLQALRPMWKVPSAESTDTLSLTPQRKEKNGKAMRDGDEVLFDPSVTTQGHLGNLFRIFTSTDPTTTPALRIHGGIEVDMDDPLACMAISRQEDDHIPSFGVGVSYAANDPRNRALHLRPEVSTVTQAWLVGITAVAQTTPPFHAVRLTNIPKHVIDLVCNKSRLLEDNNWAGSPYADDLKTLVANLRQRSAKTTFLPPTAVDPESGLLPQANQLASLALVNPAFWSPERFIPAPFVLSGAKLMSMSQSSAYKHISAMSKVAKRRGTTSNIARIQAYFPLASPANIWAATRDRAFSLTVRTFLFRAIHAAFSVGRFWRNVPEQNHLEKCPICDEEESLEHILTSCHIDVRAKLWALAKTVLRRKSVMMPEISIGSTLGCGLLVIKNRPGATRLQKIILSETTHLIWKLRCERRIQRNDNTELLHSVEEAENRWYLAINKRLNLDKLATHGRYGRHALDHDMVLKTWSGILSNEHLLPDDWTSWKSRVLVGREPPDP